LYHKISSRAGDLNRLVSW